jgi:glycosyltransferase involved in cell wall biosynthesis
VGEAALSPLATAAPVVADDTVPVAVVMITLNEAHNLRGVLDNLAGWAREIFIVDSYSADETVDIALERGVHVVQRRFRGFGDQWNFAISSLPIASPWTMKIDPDERLSPRLKESIRAAIEGGDADAYSFDRQLWFMDRSLPVRQAIVRLWRTGRCRFTDVKVNEHPMVSGAVRHLPGVLEHHDSPDLHHWLDKQNKYTSAEAINTYEGGEYAARPRILGTRLQRRMWLKANFFGIPFRYQLLFVYHYLLQGAWRSGWVGYMWSRLRCDVYRLREYKLREIRLTGRLPVDRPSAAGRPDPRVAQY